MCVSSGEGLNIEMDRSLIDGLMAVVAVSGTVAFLSVQVQKHLLADFMKKLELEIGPPGKAAKKKRVRFVDDTGTRRSSIKAAKGYVKAGRTGVIMNPGVLVKCIKYTMPPNRLALYKGITEFKTLKGHKGSTCI